MNSNTSPNMLQMQPEHGNWRAPAALRADELNQVHSDMRGRCPVAHGIDPRNDQAVWTVFRRQDVIAVARDTATYSNAKRVRLAARRIPLESDPPEHQTLRRILQPFFLPKLIEQFEATTRSIVNEALSPFIAAGGGDFAVEISRKVPTQVLLARLGQPVSEWEKVKDWSEDTVPRELKTPEDERKFAEGDSELWAYSRAVVEDRKKAPREPSQDIICALLAAGVDEELAVGCVRLLVAAGHDSTTQAFGICIHYLCSHPELQQALRINLALIPAAVEEILRLESPVVAMPRIAARDVELQGCPIRAGDKVMLNWSSANHDEGIESPQEFRLDRKTPHLVFGHGIHGCLGAPLARQELRLAIARLLTSTSGIELDGEPVMMDMAHYGFERLPVKLKFA